MPPPAASHWCWCSSAPPAIYPAEKSCRRLFALWQGKFLPEKIAIVGVAIEKYTDDQFRDLARKAIQDHGRLKPANDDEWKQFAALLSYQVGRFLPIRASFASTRPTNHRPRKTRTICPAIGCFIWQLPHRFSLRSSISFPPKDWFTATVANQPWYRVVIEKPFGHDLSQCPRARCRYSSLSAGRPDLSDRSLSRQRDGAEPDGVPLCQRDFRAAVELRICRSRANHRGRNRRHGRPPRQLLRPRRRDCAT